MAWRMRTTLTIDDEVLTAAKAIAQQQYRSVGKVMSDLARRALYKPQPPEVRNGVPLLPRESRGNSVTLDIVNALRDELP